MSEETKIATNKTLPPALLAAVLGVGVVAFFVGRGSAPVNTPPVTSESAEEGHSEEGHGEEGHNEEGHSEEGHGEEGGEEIKFEGNTAKEAGIVVAPVSLQLQTNGIPFNGQIVANPNSLVRVSSLVPGRIASLRVSPGDKVTKGQTLAVVESRAIGEAQSSYQQAVARFDNANSNLNVVMKQARAGVFSRAPIEAARRAVVDAQAEVRAQTTAVRAAQLTLDNADRLAKAGSYANPALEAARSQLAAAREAVSTAQAALDNAQANVAAAQRELERRKQLAASGTYVSRPVEEARRALVAARSGRASAQSSLATARANLSRAKSLVAEGLVAKREVEAAQNAFDTATANLDTAQSDESTAVAELERQQKVASSDVAGVSEVQTATSSLSSAQADVRARQAELARAREGLRLAELAQKREQHVFAQNIANRRETGGARSNLEAARNNLTKARQTLALANSAYAREQRILKENLNNIAQVQAARANYVQAQSDLRAARTALSLFKTSPGGGASSPITAPISGIVQERPVAPGEVLAGDANIVTLVNLDSVMVEAAIYERDMARVRVGSTMKLTVDGLAGRSFNGRIENIDTKIDPETRTLTARAFLPNTGGLKIGMFAKGSIVTASTGSAITVPDEALQKLEEKTVVFVAGDEPNSFVTREVEAGTSQNGRTIIKTGLKGGDRVVVKGAFMVKAQAMKAELGHSH